MLWMEQIITNKYDYLGCVNILQNKHIVWFEMKQRITVLFFKTFIECFEY